VPAALAAANAVSKNIPTVCQKAHHGFST